MKYTCALLSVADINAARRFYEELFGLQLDLDYGKNIVFTCGLALQQDFDRLVGLPREAVEPKASNAEIVFEEEHFDDFLEKLKSFPHIAYLGGVVEHSWGQRVIRFYDPDGHMIEVGEAMKAVIERFLDSGMTLEATAGRIDASVDALKKLLHR